MTPAASTTAWALHDLGLATSFGGSVFGRLAMQPAVGTISNRRERGELIHNAWKRFNWLNLASHGIFAATWFAGRSAMSGRSVGKQSQPLVKAKDALIVTSLVSGVASMIAGEKGIREPKTKAIPFFNRRGMVSRTASKKAKVAQAVTDTAGVINVASIAGIVGITAVLAMKAGQSRRWSLVSRLLP